PSPALWAMRFGFTVTVAHWGRALVGPESGLGLGGGGGTGVPASRYMGKPYSVVSASTLASYGPTTARPAKYDEVASFTASPIVVPCFKLVAIPVRICWP